MHHDKKLYPMHHNNNNMHHNKKLYPLHHNNCNMHHDNFKQLQYSQPALQQPALQYSPSPPQQQQQRGEPEKHPQQP